jgi:hypothetical protein
MKQQAGSGFAFHVATTEDIAEKLLGGLSTISAAQKAFAARRRQARRRRCAAFPGFHFLC